jgi:hypothetical protein
LEAERGVWASSTTPSMRRVRAREYMEVGCGGNGAALDFSVLPWSIRAYPVEDEGAEENDDEDEGDDVDAVRRFLRRCWRCGMPRCADR